MYQVYRFIFFPKKEFFKKAYKDGIKSKKKILNILYILMSRKSD